MRKRIGLMRPIGPIRLMGLISLIGLIGLMGLMGCSGGGGDDAPGLPPTPPPTPTVTETAISFSGAESLEQAVNSGGSDGANRAYGADGANRRAAGTPLSEKATTFHVWGYKNMTDGSTQQVFPGYRVDWSANSAATTTTNSKGWEYVGIVETGKQEQTIKYWDWGAAAYRYFAVTGGLTGAYKANETNKPYEFSIVADASNAEAMSATPYFSKLWFSTGNQATYPDKQFGKPVTLEFLKPYARVRFLFKYSTPRQGFKLGVPSFKPTDGSKKIARKGTVTVHYPTEEPEIKEWYTMVPQTGDDSQALEAFTVDYDPDNESKDYTGTGTDKGWYVVLPNNTQDSYTLTVNVNNSDRSVTVPKQYMQWLPGYSYTYIFKITEEGGVEIGWVEYAVTPWMDLENDKSVFNW